MKFEISGLTTLLLVLFIGLKLTNYIAWSWIWVLSPFWIPLLMVLISALIYTLIECWRK